MDGWMDRWVRGWMCHGARYITHFYCVAVEAGFCSDVVPGFDSLLGQIVCMDGCMDGTMVVWMDAWTDEWMRGFMDGWMDACIGLMYAYMHVTQYSINPSQMPKFEPVHFQQCGMCDQ